MPHTGKPSKACQVCKQRHLKCDETRPACLNCIKARRICPGYTEGLDLVLRDQNQIVKAKSDRRQKDKLKRTGTQSFLFAPGDVSSPDSLVVYSSLPESQDFYAHTFFVSGYVTVRRDPRAEHGFLEILPYFFHKLPSNSALSFAFAAVAHCYFGAWQPAIRNAHQLTVQKNYTMALGALQTALRDPRECVSDEILMAVCLLAFFEDTIGVLMSWKRAEDHIKGATALIKQRRSSTMTNDLSKWLLIAVRHTIVRNPGQSHRVILMRAQVANALATEIPVQEAPELWQDPDHMPYNTATLLNGMCLQAANVLADAAQWVSSDTSDDSSDNRRTEILLRARFVDSRLATWPSLVPQDWWPVPVEQRVIPQEILDAGVYGDHCDIYPDTTICDTWLIWRSTRLRLFALIADFDQAESKHNAVLQCQAAADDIFAAVPFMLGSKCMPADMFDTVFKYPCLPGKTVSLDHYHSAAAFGGHVLFSPLTAILERTRHLRPDQVQFAAEQIQRLGRLYDVHMPEQRSPTLHGPP
ncbi:MAG: hypothetical protein Q9208_003253 [Pyrenodesmia sp. 3 TL-2023]